MHNEARQNCTHVWLGGILSVGPFPTFDHPYIEIGVYMCMQTLIHMDAYEITYGCLPRTGGFRLTEAIFGDRAQLALLMQPIPEINFAGT